MKTEEYILITGVSGFIGGALLNHLAPGQKVLGLTRKRWRKEVPGSARVVQGDFASFEDLRQLDKYAISGLVHLAAATGGCSEEEGLAVNVQGTRRLLRYLLDKGCRKFVLASSIAAVGCLHGEFVPQEVPIPDTHPCLARDAYGFSKAMMEEVTRYLHRTQPDTAFTNLRLGVVVDDADWKPLHITANTHLDAPFAELARVRLSDVLTAITTVIRLPHRPGARTYNLVGPDATCDDTVPDVLRTFYRERAGEMDLSFYQQTGREYAAVYAMDNIKTELNFVPQQTTRGV